MCTRLWLELDIVPVVFNIKPFHTDSITRPNIKHRISSTTGSYVPSGAETPTVYVDTTQLQDSKLGTTVGNKLPIPRTVDEQADSAARKCIMYYGPGNNPRLSIGPRNQVAVDAGGKIHLLDDIEEYRKSVHPATWRTVNKLADELREKKIKMGFFSSTPQGGECGVKPTSPHFFSITQIPSISIFMTLGELIADIPLLVPFVAVSDRPYRRSRTRKIFRCGV